MRVGAALAAPAGAAMVGHPHVDTTAKAMARIPVFAMAIDARRDFAQPMAH
ncbi:hypothetical protein GCM10028795_22690 [Lysobacter olei]